MAGVLSVIGGIRFDGVVAELRNPSPCAAVTLALSAYIVVRQLVAAFKRRGTPPGSMGLPLGLGETISFTLGAGEFVRNRVKKHGEIFSTHIFFAPTIFVTGHENVKWFYKELKQIGWPEPWNDLMGKTLTTMNGQMHKTQRTLVGRAFTDQALAGYLPNIERYTEDHLQKLIEISASCPDGFDPRKEIKRYTYSVAECVGLGPGVHSTGALDHFMQYLKGFEALVYLNLPFTYFGQAMRTRKALLDIFKKTLDEKRRVRQADPAAASSDILSNVLQAEEGGKKMTDQEILDFLIVIMFAAHDTTLATIQTLLFYLAEKPGLKAELKAEIDSLWDGTSPLSYDLCTENAPKCRHFIDEALRVMPPVPGVYREIPRDMFYKGYRFPKGWKVSINFENEQQLENFDGSSFDMNSDHDKLPTKRDLTFSQGPRMCIGYKLAKLEVFVWLAHFVKNYDHKLHSHCHKKYPFNYKSVKISVSKNRVAEHGKQHMISKEWPLAVDYGTTNIGHQ
eukprot:TRINITY_DN871_c0_g1_i1.p1 TRINITY_DN871_c0_g1~~TRINITY_DN871_c0_g1_i1.p1  ORF type:complete len:508 (+),score=81.47 TRINITY_DN871_c0_g1_i1:59-1582(+)